MYCSHGPDKLTPAQLPRSGNAHQPPHSSCTAKPQVEEKAGHVVLYYLVVLKEPSLLDVCSVFIHEGPWPNPQTQGDTRLEHYKASLNLGMGVPCLLRSGQKRATRAPQHLTPPHGWYGTVFRCQMTLAQFCAAMVIIIGRSVVEDHCDAAVLPPYLFILFI